MAFSMTGFGQAELNVEGKKLSCSVKSVNNRFCEVQVRMPSFLQGLEHQVRSLCREQVSRGKLEVNLRVQEEAGESSRVVCDLALARAYQQAYEDLGDLIGRPALIDVERLATYPGVLRAEVAQADEEAWQPLLLEVVERALTAHSEMRQNEGALLVQDVLGRLERLEDLRLAVAERAPMVVEVYRERLDKRLDELLGADRQLVCDPQRLAGEVLLFADKAAVDEELVRLASHLKALRQTLKQNQAIGKKLDFLLQETNREINTIGSKANDLTITELVVEMKNETEKIREQIQNLE